MGTPPVHVAYEETRYYTKSGSEPSFTYKYYDDLVKTSTAYNDSAGEKTVSFVNPKLFDFFNINTFLARFNTQTFTVNMHTSILSEDLSIEETMNLVFDTTTAFNNYIGEIDTIMGDNEYIIDRNIGVLAKNVSYFFLVSSALYTNIGSTSEIPTDGTTSVQLNTSMPYFIYSYPSIEGTDTTPTTPGITTRLVEAYFKTLNSLEMGEGEYTSHLNRNVLLNRKFNAMDQQLTDKQEIFNDKKAFVITMMSKTHKANKQLTAKKSLLNTYLMALFVYIITCIGLVLAGNSSYPMFQAIQTTIVGTILAGLNAIILLGLLVTESMAFFGSKSMRSG